MIRDAQVRVFSGGEYVLILQEILGDARAEVLTCQYVWIWYPHSVKRWVHRVSLAAVATVKRGVKMRVILNRESAKNRLGRFNEKTAGVLRKAGAVVRMGRPGIADHSKFWVIDREVLVVCSHNLSTRSVTSNTELGVVIWSELAARDAAAYFEKLWSRG